MSCLELNYLNYRSYSNDLNPNLFTPYYRRSKEFCVQADQAVTRKSVIVLSLLGRGRFVPPRFIGEGRADFVCKWGGLRPHNPPLFRGHRCLQKTTRVKSSPPSMLAAGAKNKHLVIAMWIIYVCTRGRLCGSFCLQMGRAAPPPTPRF